MDPQNSSLKNFRLYETQSKVYIVGRNNSKTVWRVLKIDRSEPTELDIVEDSTTYSEREISALLRRLHAGNLATGGLKFVTSCYGIVGFIKFLGPYYMLLITKRKQIGEIRGHVIYGISKTKMIPIPHPSVQQTDTFSSKSENRYKKLLCSIDLTKDFFFSFTYNVTRSLQRNLCDVQTTGPVLYEKMFVWNEFLTRGISNLNNTVWTVALVYGFFKQAKLSVSGRDFKLTLISRRSRLYAGPRYHKRGVDKKGRVANDVETEQIVFEDLPGGCPVEISSVVQHRGSIPLFWSQEASLLNVKPKIRLSGRDENYKATRLHFDNLVTRYGNPIIILNLIKGREKEARESTLRGMFSDATEVINNDLSFENRLRFFHLDLAKLSKSKDIDVLESLGGLTEYSLRITGFFFHSQLSPNFVPGDDKENRLIKQTKLQKGVLRTNCIDCLDRTNVAQYSYGLAALGYQLNALGLISRPKIGQDDRLAVDLMDLYEMMGDILSLQYGGSLSHCKIFWLKKGHWKPAVKASDLIRSVRRYGSNTFTDGEKQDAINIFLGHFQPQQGKPAIWELNSDQNVNVGRDENAMLSLKRSASDGNLASVSEQESSRLVDDSTPEIIPASNSEIIATFRSSPSRRSVQLLCDMQSTPIDFYENQD
ncbi:phosphoinositide phosphatase SAC2-like, partial [Papaver somniferum]|uniref:phosphoinositide phosphatase SAC2-like n=1 Tax=Papaver somniferum TaxID=3469 RepID=UPI000E6F6434